MWYDVIWYYTMWYDVIGLYFVVVQDFGWGPIPVTPVSRVQMPSCSATLYHYQESFYFLRSKLWPFPSWPGAFCCKRPLGAYTCACSPDKPLILSWYSLDAGASIHYRTFASYAKHFRIWWWITKIDDIPFETKISTIITFGKGNGGSKMRVTRFVDMIFAYFLNIKLKSYFNLYNFITRSRNSYRLSFHLQSKLYEKSFMHWFSWKHWTCTWGYGASSILQNR